LEFSPDGSGILPVFSLKTGRYSEQQEIAPKNLYNFVSLQL
jgi:hypothetical protein